MDIKGGRVLFKVFSVLFFLALFILIIGLIKPTIVFRKGEDKTRKNVLKKAGIPALIFVIGMFVTVPDSTEDKENKTGAETTSNSQSKPVTTQPKTSTDTGSNKKTNAPTLKEIALIEKAWLEQLTPISEQIRTVYTQWENGIITKDQLVEKLAVQKPKVKELRDQEEKYYLSFKLPDEIKKNQDYNKGLYYGKSLRLNVYSFLTYATDKSKPLSDNDLKEMYRTEMVDGYERKLGYLQKSIDKLTK